MARRRRHHRRYHGTVGVNLGDLPGLGKSVNSTDVLVGAGVGVIASALLKGIANVAAPSAIAPVKAAVGGFYNALIGAATGAAVYFGAKSLMKSSPEKATSYAVGAALPGIAQSLQQLAIQYVGPASGGMLDFSGTVGVNLGVYTRNPPRSMGMLVSDNSDQGQGVPAMNGLLVADHSDNLAELAAISMGPDSDGIAELMVM